jgi:prepilin-type N-terminal cleavage/methylation domain-containing protein
VIERGKPENMPRSHDSVVHAASGAGGGVHGAAAGFSLVEILVAVAIIAGLAVLLVPGLQSVREAARRTQCANNLRQIGIGLQQYHGARDCFPNNVSVGPIRHHWCAQILPYLDENPLAESYDYAVRFDDANNMTAVQKPLGFMACPSAPNGQRQHPRFKTTSPPWSAAAADYAASDGPSAALWNAPAVVSYPRPDNWEGFLKGAAIPGARGRRIRDITDGTSKSIAVMESAGRPQVWAFGFMVPDSGRFDSSPIGTRYVPLCGWADTNQFAARGFRQDPTQADPANRSKSPGPTMINGSNNFGIYAFHAAGAAALFADGSARFLDASASADVVAAQLTVQAADDAISR